MQGTQRGSVVNNQSRRVQKRKEEKQEKEGRSVDAVGRGATVMKKLGGGKIQRRRTIKKKKKASRQQETRSRANLDWEKGSAWPEAGVGFVRPSWG